MNAGLPKLSKSGFAYPPSPQVLQWLAAGQLASRLQRAVRLWVLLRKLYGAEPNWAMELPRPFTYPKIRDRLFAVTHDSRDRLKAEQVSLYCTEDCICQHTTSRLIFGSEPELLEERWYGEAMHLTGLNAAEIEQQLQQRPFSTVHRSLREDLKQLGELGWLRSLNQGRYLCLSVKELPTPPTPLSGKTIERVSVSPTWELLRVLESVSFIQPNLELLVQSLWEELTDAAPPSHFLDREPEQRIFLHLDYILSPEIQDRVDNYQEQLEKLWLHSSGGVVRFSYLLVREEREVEVNVYPVCLHYVRRAKYLSAYGVDPMGRFGWHNYRLDRITSERLKVLAWGDPLVPKRLKDLWYAGELPTSADVQSELDAAWGFNFYLPRKLLILRFPPAFARWYVDGTMRHPTFEQIDYHLLGQAIAKQVPEPQERQYLLQVLKHRDPNDTYYTAWVREGDINVLMRLRDWRPNGEVIAPVYLRKLLAQESSQELLNYQIEQDGAL